MKLLLTSAGIKNTSIRNALVDLLGKPIDQCNALCIPTAIYAFPGGPASAWKLVVGRAASPLCELGWKSLGVLELTALPTIEKALWTLRSRKQTPSWWEAAILCTSPTGFRNRDWSSSCRRWARRSGWG